jgi:hypothetical protein
MTCGSRPISFGARIYRFFFLSCKIYISYLVALKIVQFVLLESL